MQARAGILGGLALLGGAAPLAAPAEENLRSPDAQIERIVRSVWVRGGNYRPLCASLPFLNLDQWGVQELQQVFAPGQWAVRLARTTQREPQIRTLDHLAKFGLLERTDNFINVGPIQGLPAAEYRPTVSGWVQSMARGEAPSTPCFYFGMAQVLKVLGYSESAKDDFGLSKVTVHFLKGAEEMAEWARAEEAAQLLTIVRESLHGQKATFDFYRDSKGQFRTHRGGKPIDDTIPAVPAASPGIEAAREGIARSQEAPKPVLPKPCFTLLPKPVAQLWKEGDSSAAARSVLRIPEARGSAREPAALAYARLSRLQRAGLVSLQGDPKPGGEVVVRPSAKIRPLIAVHGNCLPLGKVRVEVAGVQPDDWVATRQRFKARYIVEAPDDWIRDLKNAALMPDLDAILRHGQPFEGTTLKMPNGWAVTELRDQRPRLVRPSLSSVGVSPDWRNVTEISIAAASVVNHEVHFVKAYGGGRSRGVSKGTQRAAARIDVLVKKRTLPLLIVLNGYDPTQWRFRLEPGARVDAVLATGSSHEQQITGLPKGTGIVNAYGSDSELRFDAAMTYIGIFDRAPLVSRLGIQPVSTQETDGEPVVVGAN